MEVDYSVENVVDQIVSVFEERELKLFEIFDTNGNPIDLRRQLIIRYGNKCTAIKSLDLIKRTVVGLIKRNIKFLKETNKPEFIEFFIRELGRGIFVSKHTFLLNLKMAENKKDMKVDGLVMKTINYLIGRLNKKHLGLFEEDYGEGMVDLRTQLIRRYSQKYLKFSRVHCVEKLNQFVFDIEVILEENKGDKEDFIRQKNYIFEILDGFFEDQKGQSYLSWFIFKFSGCSRIIFGTFSVCFWVFLYFLAIVLLFIKKT